MAIAGLSLGVAALVIVLSVMNGFEKELQTRVLGVVPQLVIRSNDNLENYKEIADIIDISGGLETSGIKDKSKIDIFLNKVEQVQNET